MSDVYEVERNGEMVEVTEDQLMEEEKDLFIAQLIAEQNDTAKEENDMNDDRSLTQDEIEELAELEAAAKEAKAVLEAANARRKELSEAAIRDREARIADLREQLTFEKEELAKLGGGKSVFASKYKKKYGKAASCNDWVANALAGVEPATLIEAAFEQGLLTQSKHGHLNTGMKSVTARNKIRNLARNAEVGTLLFEVDGIEIRARG